MYKIKKIYKPEMYQGHKKSRRYFEGWYYKLIGNNEESKIAIIPGVSKDEKGLSHAFIQVINGNDHSVDYFKYDMASFKYSRKRFEIVIGDNYFSKKNLILNTKNNNKYIKGTLSFDGLKPWPVKYLSPGIMGWFSYIPFMECYHGVISLDHSIDGSLIMDNKKFDFNGGRGYIEKDWGRSFPKGWIWTQSNHFSEEKVSLTASIAKIPWMGKSFTGFIIGLLYNGKLYRFATYTGAKIEKLHVNKNEFYAIFSDKKLRLELFGNKDGGGKLYSPSLGMMSGKVSESLTSKIKVKLVSKNDNTSIFEGVGRNAGMEMNNVEVL